MSGGKTTNLTFDTEEEAKSWLNDITAASTRTMSKLTINESESQLAKQPSNPNNVNISQSNIHHHQHENDHHQHQDHHDHRHHHNNNNDNNHNQNHHKLLTSLSELLKKKEKQSKSNLPLAEQVAHYTNEWQGGEDMIYAQYLLKNIPDLLETLQSASNLVKQKTSGQKSVVGSLEGEDESDDYDSDKEIDLRRSGTSRFAVALFDYQSEFESDLSFKQGDMLELSLREGDWWEAKIGNKEGWIPANYVELLG